MFNKDSFPLIESKTLRGRDGINLLVHAYRSNSLFFFPYFLIFLLFFLFLSFLNACFLFRGFLLRSYYPHSWSPCTARVPFFIVPTVTGFYYFNPYPPLSGLGVLADHHWFICVGCATLTTRQRGLFCLFVCCDILTCYGVSALSLSLYPLWHAPSGSHLPLLLLGGMSSQQDISPKRA